MIPWAVAFLILAVVGAVLGFGIFDGELLGVVFQMTTVMMLSLFVASVVLL